MLDREWALEFAREWVDSWNSHCLERILSHYADDFRMSSPLIVARTGLNEGVLQGKDAVARYWRPSLGMEPPLRFMDCRALRRSPSKSALNASSIGAGPTTASAPAPLSALGGA